MVQQEAIVVKNAVKRYGKGKVVLNGLHMSVSRGSIYGLLGASGCGKTTLLSCVVGVRYLDSGEIWVLGGNPGDKGSGIPGPRVGYMPQEISLIGEFTVSGALYYFGRINGLDDKEIETRQTFFSKLLQLPPADRLVKNMSGGQQRRVSFAAALIHKPELLILDEPTVGLDPILRENIWAYLSKIAQEEDITVLITTHYIEETKDANKIGLMRCGQLLAESTPQQLLDRFQCLSLEEAFLKLCEIQSNTDILNEVQGSKAEGINCDVLYQDQNRYKQTNEILDHKAIPERQVSRARRFKALLAKNSIQFLRYYTGLAFAIIFPILQTGVFIFSIGDDPKDLKIGIVNDEAGNCNYSNSLGNVWNDEINCYFSNLSCRFLHNFGNSIATQEYYDDISEANHALKKGKLSGVIYFNQNFSEGMQRRIEEANFAKDSDLIASQIQVYMDFSDRQIGLFIEKNLFERFLEIFEDIMRDCKYSSKLANPPIRFEDPIYGSTDLNYADFMTPAYMLTLTFFLATTVSTSLLISDRLEGVWDRSVVQGVKTEEILLSHILIQSVIISIHTIMVALLIFPIWGLECKGSVFVVIVFMFFSGFTGLMFGFIISVLCKNHTMAHFSSAGSFFPLILLNGCIWPIEGMPKALRWFSYVLPTTLPSISVRDIIYKGHSISESDVYIGLFINLGWILIYFIIIILGLRAKSS